MKIFDLKLNPELLGPFADYMLIISIIASLLLTVVLKVFLSYINSLLKPVNERRLRWLNDFSTKSLRIKDLTQLYDILTPLCDSLYFFVFLLTIFFYILLIFSFFPATHHLSDFMWISLQKFYNSSITYFIAFVPNFISIVLISIACLFILKIFKILLSSISSGELFLHGFRKRWTEPTYKLVRIFLVALALIMIFPLIPGSNSPVFQGVGVFLGLLISLGSTTVISNILAGSVLIYSRSFLITH
jgi:small-conductance mechanosensitive channel